MTTRKAREPAGWLGWGEKIASASGGITRNVGRTIRRTNTNTIPRTAKVITSGASAELEFTGITAGGSDTGVIKVKSGRVTFSISAPGSPGAYGDGTPRWAITVNGTVAGLGSANWNVVAPGTAYTIGVTNLGADTADVTVTVTAIAVAGVTLSKS